MASVVFPDATLAVWLDARPELRAARRVAQNPGEGGSVEQVAAALAERDRRDSSRQHAPLIRTERAVVVDTSGLSLDEVVETVAARLADAVRGAEAGADPSAPPRRGAAAPGAS
jgi:cytidylate kinase